MMTIICCERREGRTGEKRRRENLLTAVSKLMEGGKEGWADADRERQREGGMWSDFPSFGLG